MNMETKETMREGWHLDKKVPLSIIFAVFVQTAVLVLWASKLDSRVAAMEQNVSSHNIAIETLKGTQTAITVGLARMEERQIITAEGVKEIKARLDEKRH